jgi:hypothetical protein
LARGLIIIPDFGSTESRVTVQKFLQLRGWTFGKIAATISGKGMKRFLILFMSAAILSGVNFARAKDLNEFCRFVGLEKFSNFKISETINGEKVLLSSKIKSAMDWNELIVSWNADAPAGTFLKVEARAILPDHETKFYTMGLWSPDNEIFPRTSVRGQKDLDGDVKEDTLFLKNLATAAQIRVTLGGTNSEMPKLKFLGLAFCNTEISPTTNSPNRKAWGKIISTPERSQHVPGEKGWCSPTSLSMALARWSEILQRPEMNLTVPQVAAAVYDDDYDGTGNWPFNTAFAGSFPGMRSYVTQFNDISELETWIDAGIPVIISARWDLLKPGRENTGSGHLSVCIGFTENGDVVINDPATNLKKESVRHIYKREDVIRAWATSGNVVYLVFPETAKIPKNKNGHW